MLVVNWLNIANCVAELNINKHLMTGPTGNSEFCFPETLNVPRGKAEGSIEGPNSKIEQINLTYVSKELRSVFFSSSKLCGKFCSLQNSYKVLTAFCDALFVDFELLSRINCSISSSVRTWKRFAAMTEKTLFLTRLDTNSRRTTWSRASRKFKLLFPLELVRFFALGS